MNIDLSTLKAHAQGRWHHIQLLTNTSLAPIVAVKTVSVTPTIKAMADLFVINAPLKAA